MSTTPAAGRSGSGRGEVGKRRNTRGDESRGTDPRTDTSLRTVDLLSGVEEGGDDDDDEESEKDEESEEEDESDESEDEESDESDGLAVQPELGSFKRRQKQAVPRTRRNSSRNSDAAGPSRIPDAGSSSASIAHTSKTLPSTTDWYAEGVGRRVGYEDLTSIDWIFEYNKERQRQRVLVAGTPGLLGHVRRLLDAGQVWAVLVMTGVAMGTLAAAIDVVSDWLGDLKTGYCASGGPDGGAFYLNHGFCCLGYDQDDQCDGWRSWSRALGVHSSGTSTGTSSGVGAWAVEYVFYVGLSVALAVVASVLVQAYAPYAQHSGIAEVKTMLSGLVMRRFLGAWTLVIKSLGLCAAVASGLWLGKEGPFVHVACCCANQFARLFPSIHTNEARRREVLSAASASGISVAFGSPIGGVLFSLETLSYYFPDKTMWQSFVCAMTAALVLQALDPFRSGKLVLYQVTYSSGWHAFELVPFALLGVVGGVYGGLFIHANIAVARWKRAKSQTGWLPRPVVQVALVALLSALVNYPNVYMRAQSSELVSSLFAECTALANDPLGLCTTGAAAATTIALLLLAAVLGFALAAVTFGLQIPAGIILPSMAIGALVGRAVGIVVATVVDAGLHRHPDALLFATCEPDTPCVTPGTYAIVGAAAALTGVTRVTVSIVVIVFELTGALTYVLPIMVAVMISKWVGDAFSRRGIYEAWIDWHEYPYLDNADADALPVPDVPAADVMTRIDDLVVLAATGHTVASLLAILDAHPYRGFPVVRHAQDVAEEHALLLGYISRAELAYTLHAATQPPRALPPATTEAYFVHQPLADPRTTLDLRPWMDHTPLTLASRASLHLVVSYFQKLGLRYVLITDRGVLQGLLTKKDVWHVLHGDRGASRERAHSQDSEEHSLLR